MDEVKEGKYRNMIGWIDWTLLVESADLELADTEGWL